jgi:hypothetical protein
MRARSQPGQESIPIPIPTPTPIQAMIGLIGNPSYPYRYPYPYPYPYTYTYPYLYPYSPDHRVRARVPLRCVRVRFWAVLEAVRKGPWEARSGSGSLSVSVSKGRVMGFGHEKPGTTTVLLRCRHNSAAKFERYKRARCQPGRDSIPIPIPTPTPIQTMI